MWLAVAREVAAREETSTPAWGAVKAARRTVDGNISGPQDRLCGARRWKRGESLCRYGCVVIIAMTLTMRKLEEQAKRLVKTGGLRQRLRSTSASADRLYDSARTHGGYRAPTGTACAQ